LGSKKAPQLGWKITTRQQERWGKKKMCPLDEGNDAPRKTKKKSLKIDKITGVQAACCCKKSV